MELFSFSFELTRLVFLCGAVFATLYKKRTGITPGGIIAPSFLAIVMDSHFAWLGIMLAITVVCRTLYDQIFSSFALPRKWMVFANITMSTILTIGTQLLLSRYLPFTEAVAYGFVIPGLVSSNSIIYGKYAVVKGMMLVTAVTYLAGVLLSFIIPFGIATRLSVQLSEFTPLSIENHYIALLISLIAAGLVMYRLGARSGGYLLAPAVAFILANSFVQFILFLIGLIINYLVVRFILKHSLIIGLERFLLCLLLATFTITATDMLAIKLGLDSYYTSPIVFMVAMAVILNDMCLQNIRKLSTTVGLASPIAASFLLGLGVH